jgi:hypothetical protein
MGSFCKSASLLISTLILCMDAQAGATLNAKLSDIKPSQTDVGKAHVEFSKTKILKYAADKKVDLFQAIGSRVLPAWITPDGKYNIIDGHHWASGALKVAQENSNGDAALFEKFYLTLNILEDYSGKSWEEFYLDLYKTGQCYFRPDLRKQFEQNDVNGNIFIADEDIVTMFVKYLPKNLEGLANNSWRSLIGISLEEMGFAPPEQMVNFVEFYIWENFGSDFKKLDPSFAGLDFGADMTPLQAQLVKDQLVSDVRMANFLVKSAKPLDANPEGGVAENQKKILGVINVNRARLQLPPL